MRRLGRIEVGMSDQKADAVAVSRLESRIDPRARVVPSRSLTSCNWGDSEVILLKQDGPWDTRDLLFIGLCCELEPKGV